MARAVTVETFWREFCRRHGVPPDQRYDAYRFGDSIEMADELAALVMHGPKRATAGLLDDFGPGKDPLPEVGVHSVILNGRDEPVCVVRTTGVEVKRLGQVDESFAWDEGEGDRTVEWWVAAHRRYFTRDLARRGRSFSEDMPVVFERFDLIWPVSA